MPPMPAHPAMEALGKKETVRCVVARSASRVSNAEESRIATRWWGRPDREGWYLGFRLAKTIEP